jgi:hypothetical protein
MATESGGRKAEEDSFVSLILSENRFPLFTVML